MSLYQLERDGDVQDIIDVLRSSDNADIRQRAAGLLGNFPDHDDRADIVSALVRAAEQDDDDAVTAAAVDSLEELGDDAIDKLIASMAGVDFDDGADWVRAKAFRKALSSDVPELRMAAASGLGQYGENDALEPLAGALEDGDPRVRARAARALGKIAD
ncbi:HEAT repeat domain-containing protein, partial [Halapricum sp. CBA1109]|uniref:HEAT repeat domain-containing protein n=1 Tax=Halapricum sp. CBA1109 TaxID=2668068 RepID=UPI0013BE1339